MSIEYCKGCGHNLGTHNTFRELGRKCRMGCNCRGWIRKPKVVCRNRAEGIPADQCRCGFCDRILAIAPATFEAHEVQTIDIGGYPVKSDQSELVPPNTAYIYNGNTNGTSYSSDTTFTISTGANTFATQYPAQSVDLTPKCPSCSSKMVSRHRRRDNKEFWGCSKFPKCYGSRDLNDVVSKTDEQWLRERIQEMREIGRLVA